MKCGLWLIPKLTQPGLGLQSVEELSNQLVGIQAKETKYQLTTLCQKYHLKTAFVDLEVSLGIVISVGQKGTGETSQIEDGNNMIRPR